MGSHLCTSIFNTISCKHVSIYLSVFVCMLQLMVRDDYLFANSMASSSTLSLLSLSSVLLVSSQYRDCAIVVVNMVARSGCDTSVVLDSVSYGRHMLVIISVVYQADICAVVELILSI